MKKIAMLLVLSVFMVLVVAGATTATTEASPGGNACWGQATAAFAQTGVMGEHSSSQTNPRLGLRNLARALAEAGIIPDDSMHSLGVFVTNELGLSIDACTV